MSSVFQPDVLKGKVAYVAGGMVNLNNEYLSGNLDEGLPEDVCNHVPCWDQIPLEEFHTGYVESISTEDWDALLHLTPEE